MVHSIILLLLSANVLVSQCQEDVPDVDMPDFLTEQDPGLRKNTSPSYSYGYGVQDAKTGDLKTAWEEKEGDTVKGHYSVLEPDGSVRTVQYKADAKSGFNAVVKNQKPNFPVDSIDSSDSEPATQIQDPDHYKVMESDGSIKTVFYRPNLKSSFKEEPNVVPMDAIDIWHLDRAPRMQAPIPYSVPTTSGSEYKSKSNVESTSNTMSKKGLMDQQMDFMESLRLEKTPRMQDKSLRDYGKLEPAFDYPAFTSVAESEGKPKFSFEDQKEFPQLWSYRDYLKKLSDDSEKIKKHAKRGSYKKHKYPSLVEFDLSQGKYPDNLSVKENSFGEPTSEHALEKYLAAQSNDFKKFLSPFANNPFRLPNIFGGDFGGLKSLSDKYRPKPESFSDVHEYVSASEIAQSFPDLDILKSKRKPYMKHKYPGLLPLPYSTAASSLEDDFIIIPKKKYLEHSKLHDPAFDSYAQHLEQNVRNVDDGYEPHHVHDEKCNHNKEKNKDVLVRKYVKKSKKPVINLLEIFDL